MPCGLGPRLAPEGIGPDAVADGPAQSRVRLPASRLFTPQGAEIDPSAEASLDCLGSEARRTPDGSS